MHTSPYSTALSIAGFSSPYFLIRSVLQRIVQAYMADTQSIYVYGLSVVTGIILLHILILLLTRKVNNDYESWSETATEMKKK